MAQAPIAEQPVDVPTTRRLRQPWPRGQESPRWSEDLERAAAALPEEVAQAMIAVMAARLVASAMDARLPATRTSPLQRLDRRLRESVDTFNRQFG